MLVVIQFNLTKKRNNEINNGSSDNKALTYQASTTYQQGLFYRKREEE